MAFLATSISPNTASAGGGTTAYITGTDLDDTTIVTIGGNTAAFEVVNPVLLRVIIPAHAAGAVNVVVTDGSTPTTLTGALTYSAIDASEQLAATLARKYKVDVNTGTIASPVWTPVRAIADLKQPVDPNAEDDSDYDAGIWASEVVTQLKWSVELKLLRKIGTTSTAYDPGQEALRAKSVLAAAEGLVQIRVYDRDGGPEAYKGLVSVSWTPEGGDTKALDIATAKLSGNGERTTITNPAA